VRTGVARLRVAAAVAERIELLDIADRERGLRGDEGAQPDLEGAVLERVERPARQPERVALGATQNQNARRAVLDRHDRRGQPNLDRRCGSMGRGILSLP
jgi:hypothetical protein